MDRPQPQLDEIPNVAVAHRLWTAQLACVRPADDYAVMLERGAATRSTPRQRSLVLLAILGVASRAGLALMGEIGAAIDREHTALTAVSEGAPRARVEGRLRELQRLAAEVEGKLVELGRREGELGRTLGVPVYGERRATS